MTVVAVVGCGRVADCSHFPALSRMDDVRIKYACDLLIEKAVAMKEKYPKVENVITDYNIALADSEVDAVFVLTPNYAHYTVAMDALRSGKHVFCEKPVTVNYALSLEMAEAAHRAGKILNIGVCNRYHRSVERLREMADRGDFGNIYAVHCSFRAFRSIPGLGGAFTDKSQSGGGVLIDWGIHFFDLILYILGSPRLLTLSASTYCEMAKDMHSYRYRSMWAENTKNLDGVNDVDDMVTGFIRTSGASITFTGAWAHNIDVNEKFVDIMGDRGGARLTYCGNFVYWNGETLERFEPEFENPNMYFSEDLAFLESCKTGEPNRSYIDNILNSMLLLDSLYKSAESGREIVLD